MLTFIIRLNAITVKTVTGFKTISSFYSEIVIFLYDSAEFHKNQTECPYIIIY